MLSQRAKDLFAQLDLPYEAVAIKLCYGRPEGVAHVDREMSFCQFIREAQDTGKQFYITAADDNCAGKMVLGMVEESGLGASGQAGYDFGIFKTPAANSRLYEMMPRLTRGAHNFVIFSPISLCDFDPDLVIAVADTASAEILMRATSYISGDLWESKLSYSVSCAWMYAYPYITGKVNYCITGMHHGMKRRGTYPPGLHIIAIPYQKLDEVIRALDEMEWVPIAFRDDEESKQELARRMASWQKIDPTLSLKE